MNLPKNCFKYREIFYVFGVLLALFPAVVSFGENVKTSYSSYPQRLPGYPDAVQVTEGVDGETGNRQAVYFTYTAPVWVADFYRRTMAGAGWQVVIQQPQKLNFLDDTFLLGFQKGSRHFTVFASRVDGDRTVITTFYREDKGRKR
jgi:hypothetical protein